IDRVRVPDRAGRSDADGRARASLVDRRCGLHPARREQSDLTIKRGGEDQLPRLTPATRRAYYSPSSPPPTGDADAGSGVPDRRVAGFDTAAAWSHHGGSAPRFVLPRTLHLDSWR